MDACVLDSSAILALIFQEPGAATVERATVESLAYVSSVNLAEAASVITQRGGSADDARTMLSAVTFAVDDFGTALAFEVARLRPLTASFGLSLGDRACLALARLRGYAALTSDQRWGDLDIGVDIVLIR